VRKRSFLHGAAVLAVGNVLSRALGAVYRIILPVLMGGGERAAVGMGLFGMAYPVYTLILGISGVGVPLAVSKLVAEHVARGDAPGARRVFRVALAVLAVLGAASSAALWAAAPAVAAWIDRDPRAALSIRAIAPAILFVALMSAYRGFFQGLQHMVPHAASQVVEQLVRILTMFALTALLLPLGIAYAAAGASFGAVTGAVAGLAFLWRAYRRSSAASAVRLARETAAGESVARTLWRLAQLAVPISLSGMVVPLMNLVDASVVPMRLHAAGLGDRATALFGVLTGYAMPFVVAPTALTAMLQVSVLPSVSEAAASGDWDGVRRRAATALRVTLVLAVPAAVGLGVLARPIPVLFFHAPEAGPALGAMASAVVFMGVQQVSSGVLQGLGLPGLPMADLLAGTLVKLALSWWLVALPAVHIVGAALGTTAGFAVAAALNLLWLRLRVGPFVDWDRGLVRPLLAAAVMGLAARGILAVGLPRVGLGAATAASVAAGAGVYGVALLAAGGLGEDDLRRLPRVGPGLCRLLRRARLLRA
jgi:stage V sporulation protein B